MKGKTKRFEHIRKVLIVLILAAAVILLAGALGRRSGERGPRGGTDQQRTEYLSSLGWEADSASCQEQIILLPAEFPEVLKNYNEMQKQQGFDLERYAGKEVTMVTYPLTNYPSTDEEVLCSLYIFKGRIIGGDIHSTAFDGFMRPLQ